MTADPATPRSVAVRALERADAPRYRALMLEAYADAPDAFTSTPQERAAEPLAWWERRIDDPAGLGAAFGAFGDAAALVGAVSVEYSAREKTRHKAHLVGMYVQPAARGLGAGAALLAAALAHARARAEVQVVTLTVTFGNAPAIALYRRSGFVEFGVEPMAVRLDDGFASKVHMACRWGRLP